MQQWSRILIQVANSAIAKMLVCKNAVYNLVNCNDIKEISKICLEVVCAVMDCNNAKILFENEESFCEITQNGFRYLDLSESEYSEFSEILVSKKILKEDLSGTFTMHVPINFNELSGFLKLTSDKNKNCNKYVDFRVENEQMLLELCKKIGEAVYNFPESNNESLKSLSQCIKMMALQYKPLALNYVINNAAKSLVDGERATLYSYKDNNLIVEPQGIEHEVPRNFSIKDGEGVIYHVFNNRKGEIVSSPYTDERFDPLMDKLTGFKTVNIVAIPLITDFDKFGAIEVINKRCGRFGKADLKLLEKFGDVVCMVLEIMHTMQITLEERFRLLAISNTMENYILVFNEHRKLVYINKPIDKIFGVSKEEIMNLTYFA